MSRIGINPNVSSDQLEARMKPDVQPSGDAETGVTEKTEGSRDAEEQGGAVDLVNDGVHKVYLHRAQLEIYNWQSNITFVRAARGFGKTSLLGVNEAKCALGMPRQMGGFLGSSAKQLFTRTVPNCLKVLNQLGFEDGVYYFRGQAPTRLRWETPLAKPRNWENVIHFQNGYVLIMLSLAVKGSANGLNLAHLMADETKYLPWQRVKEEVIPAVRGDYMPPEARKMEVRRWGYGTDGRVNPYWLSMIFCSDAGLTQSQCLWEKEENAETADVNRQIAEMLAELRFLEKRSPKKAVQLAQNDVFLKKLHQLRHQSTTFWNFSSIENAAMLGGEEWINRMKRELPDLMFRIQILGQKKGAARDGFYSNWDAELHTYTCDDVSTYDLIADKFTVKQKGKALDVQNWPTAYETENIDFEQCQAAADNCSLDTDVDYGEPLRIAIDCNANLNCMIVGQTRTINGRPTLMVLKSFFVMNERKLRTLCREEFTRYYKPFLRRNGEVIFYYTATIKQGGATAYAVENSENSRFDKVVISELQQLGWKVTDVDMGGAWPHYQKYQFINDVLSFQTTPALLINKEAGRNDYLITAIENAGIVPGTFRKDKSHEKLKNTDPDSMGGDPRERTDVTDALDDLLIGVKTCGDGAGGRIGGALIGRGLPFALTRRKAS